MRDPTESMPVLLLELLAEVERTAPGLSLGQLTIFLHVIKSEGLRVSDLACLCGISDATASRGVRAMAAAGEPGTLGAAHGLVELLRGVDGRARHLALTPRGVGLADRLAGLLHGCSEKTASAAITPEPAHFSQTTMG